MARTVRLPLMLALSRLGFAQADGTRLHIRNGCKREPIWIAHMAGATVGPDAENIEIKPDEVHEFATPNGLAATRYWPKMGCDKSGNNCTLGGSGGPGESCVRRPPEVASDDYSRCAPPIDTKFEGTFGDPTMQCTDANAQGCDYVDMSLVDGWTLPFQLKLHGSCTGVKGTQQDLVIDCRGLTLDGCPESEHLSAAGITVDLRAKHPDTKQTAGCYAPCQRLIGDKWGQKPMNAADPKAAPYCCPTPPETPEACRSGPILETTFLKTVHGKCPGVYGYAYDDGQGLLRCTPTTVYELTFFCADAETDYQKGRQELEAAAKEAAAKKQAAEKAEQARAAAAKKQASLEKAVEARAKVPAPPVPVDATVASKAKASPTTAGGVGGVNGPSLQIEAKVEAFGIAPVGAGVRHGLTLAGVCILVSLVALVALMRRYRKHNERHYGHDFSEDDDDDDDGDGSCRVVARLLAA